MLDARPFGKGYPGFDPSLGSYREILARVFPDGKPDLLITHFHPSPPDFKLPYPDLDQVDVPKAIYLGDYWGVTEGHTAAFQAFVDRYGIGVVLSYFPQPLRLFPPALAAKTVWIPPAADPAIFNDWREPKAYDVGFLAAGTTDFTPFYPERYAIHQLLLKERGLSYLWAEHPGWQMHQTDHPLVGKGYSKKINACRAFVTTSGRYRNLHAKYFEIIASGSALFADDAEGAAEMGFRDGENFVRIDPRNVVEKIRHYLAHPQSLARIAEAGFALALRRHSCYSRASDFLDEVGPLLSASQDGPASGSAGEAKVRIAFGTEAWPGYANLLSPATAKEEMRDRLLALDRGFAAGTLEEIQILHALDILTLSEAREMLSRARALLRSGGRLVVETANTERMAAKIVKNYGDNFDEYLEGVRGFHGFGLDDVEAKRRYAPAAFSWSPWHLAEELRRIGFEFPQGMPSRVGSAWRDFRMECEK